MERQLKHNSASQINSYVRFLNEAVLVENAVSKLYAIYCISIGIGTFLNEHFQLVPTGSFKAVDFNKGVEKLLNPKQGKVPKSKTCCRNSFFTTLKIALKIHE